ncbi:RNA polymerase recycling motor HelD [Shouchella hunanensis]|uniref:RNA polymerase recycling motor HelD n=1 Tax=Shouchella hunanensis TaxID=766894 RepID=A0ABY7W8L6_9BACI|nr:RNA polymerase recycling motor HelD [Shouchella hunanensis]WDF03974.1 RNA polymerase recycling motor HelD [Shouchella hunanensis]
MQYEYERAAFIHAFIRTKQTLLKQQLEGVHEDEKEIKETFWDNVTMNFSNTEDAEETISSIRQQAELLHERERSSDVMKKQMKTLRRLANAPYFGRIDLKEEGQKQEDPIYIGLASLMNESEEEFLIYDWRAPISSVYYDAEIGPVSYNAPAGKIEADLVGKRQYVFRRGQLKAMFDTSLAIGDERLKDALSDQASTSMKTIVSTIQKEQNKAIRNEKNRFLIVQGVAGSGKTSVAMQRAAYLLFRHREQLDAQQLILFSPNELFSNYVSTVLPELGEENMTQQTLKGYLYKRLGKKFEVENHFEQLEFMLSNETTERYRTRKRSIELKSSPLFKHYLDDYLAELEIDGVLFKDLRFKGSTIVKKTDIQTYFYCLDHSITLQNRLKLTAEWLLKELAKQEGKERSSDWVEQERELADKETLMQTYHQVDGKQLNSDTFDLEEQQEKLLAKRIAKAAFKPLQRLVRSFSFLDSDAMYEQFLLSDRHKKIDGFSEVALFTVHELGEGRMPYEDATPYLYLLDQLKGLQVDRSIKHVFIDEAQDYSSFQLMYLQMLYPRARFTIVGDYSQSLNHQFGTAAELLAGIGLPKESTYIEFKKSYRSTKPIMSFSRELLPEPKKVEPFDRDGKQPTIVQAANQVTVIKPMVEFIESSQDEGYQTIAILTKTAEEAKKAHATLSEWLTIQLVTEDHHEYDTGIVVLPIYLAKGIEFDSVLVFNASDQQFHTEQERFHLYTACTRAMHELALFSVGAPSRFLQEIDESAYKKQTLS